MSKDGRVLKTWNFADIISAAMTAGGDDPTRFVQPSPVDWFHSNAATYRRSDDSLLVSSRENFVICVDYNTGAIRWILGDTTKQWYQFPSLRKYALTLSPGSEPPVGQHALSITAEDNLLLFDDGTGSNSHTPPGISRTFSAAREYRIDTSARTAIEVWTFDHGQSLYSAYCSSIYRDPGLSYLVDYSYIVNLGPGTYAQLEGLNSTGEAAFAYRYPTSTCSEGVRRDAVASRANLLLD